MGYLRYHNGLSSGVHATHIAILCCESPAWAAAIVEDIELDDTSVIAVVSGC